jgi:S1-C subfamily serine protease
VANGATSRTTRRLLPGIISAMTREVPAEGGAALGVVLEPGDGRLTVKEVRDDSGAEKAGVKMGDVLETINGTEIESIETLAKLFETAKAGDKVKLGIQRGNESLELEVELASKGELFGGAQEGNDRMSGSFSKRRSGFPRVIQHSIIANNASMGGPVLDLTGQCVGMNIARANRAETFAIPAEQLKELAERMIQETR